MGAEPQRLPHHHIMFFPLMAAGHMIPTLDIAKLFASHNVKTTIVTTPLNATYFTKPLESYKTNGPPIQVEIIPFPSEKAGLPEGSENFDQLDSDEMGVKLLKATDLLQESLEQMVDKHKPNCLVADMFLPFANEVASKFNIPRLVFHGTNYLAQCVAYSLFKYEPHKSVSSDDDGNDHEFVIPHLPHEIKLELSQLPDIILGNNGDNNNDNPVFEDWMKVYGRAIEAEEKSFGVIVNSFYELEPDYVDHYRHVMGRKAWSIGPVSLCNRENEAKFQRGKDSSIGEYECLKWLDSKKPNSVVYVCFGSLTEVSTSQLQGIAMGLEASEQDFIWVVRRISSSNGSSDNNNNNNNIGDREEDQEEEEWLPQGFEKRVEGKGLIIRGWAPQVMILDHEAVGAFVTHCGWNSTMEAISCGVPMVTWPAFAEQFYNEKLVKDILRVGVGVGAKKWNRILENNVKWEDIKEVITRVMVGEEAIEIRNRANKIKEMATKAVEIGGSSYCNMDSLLHELSSYNAS